jgi:hypothetical protein
MVARLPLPAIPVPVISDHLGKVYYYLHTCRVHIQTVLSYLMSSNQPDVAGMMYYSDSS